jgi:CRP-like cAMP-binding protein
MGRRGVLRGLCDKHPEVYCRLIKEDSTFVCVKCTSSELVKDLSSLTKNSYPWQSEASTFAEKKERFATLFEKMNLNKKSENISRSQQLFYKTKTTDTTNATIEGGSSSTDFKSALENLKSIKKDMDVRMYNYNNKKNDLLDEVRARRASNLKTKEKIIKYDEVDIGSKDNKIKSSTFKGSYDEFSANETAGTGGVMIPSDDAAGTRKRIQLFERTNVREDDLLQELMSNSSMSQIDVDTKDLLSLSMSNFLFLEQDLKDNSKMKYLLKAFQKEEFAAGATIIAQGEPGSKLYILDCGTVEIFINNEFVREMNRGAIFGELALLYDAPRSATVRCKAGYETVVLWSLNRAIFKQIQIESSSNVQMQRSRWLVNCKDLAVLGAIDLQRLVSSLQVLELAADTKVYTMNQLSDEVIIIEKGFVSIYASESLRGKSLEDIDAALGIIRPPGSPKYVFEENAMYARTLVAEATREGHPSSSIPAVHVCDVMEGW